MIQIGGQGLNLLLYIAVKGKGSLERLILQLGLALLSSFMSFWLFSKEPYVAHQLIRRRENSEDENCHHRKAHLAIEISRYIRLNLELLLSDCVICI